VPNPNQRDASIDAECSLYEVNIEKSTTVYVWAKSETNAEYVAESQCEDDDFETWASASKRGLDAEGELKPRLADWDNDCCVYDVQRKSPSMAEIIDILRVREANKPDPRQMGLFGKKAGDEA
jgi:hypothetical protein